MDISDINKVGNRQRMSEDAKKLREKVSQETAKIIRLKVAQDTAYWDLKEKLMQVQGSHERLQQNMVDVQMQYETISGQYLEELRVRPETLNKVTSTRQVCDVLEEYSGRLKATVSRCKVDQSALCQAYAGSAQRVQDLHAEIVRKHDSQLRTISGLEEKLTLNAEHQNQVIQYLRSAQQHSEAAAEDARASYIHTLANQAQLTTQVQLRDAEVNQKDDTIATLQNDMKRLIQEFDSHSANAKQIIAKQEIDLSISTEAKESLEIALRNQEIKANEACENIRKVTEQLVAANEARDHALHTNALLRQQLQDAKASVDRLNLSVSELSEGKRDLENSIKENNIQVSKAVDRLNLSITELMNRNNDLENIIKENNQIYKDKEAECENFAFQLSTLELEKIEVASQLDAVVAERDRAVNAIEQMESVLASVELKSRETENDFNKYRESSDETRIHLEAAVSTKERELKSASDTISQLMREVQIEAEMRHAAEEARDQMRRDSEAAASTHAHEQTLLRAKVDHLDFTVKRKESELEEHMKMVLDMRGDKERLREKIQNMQNTIDNIQKELVGRAPNTTIKGDLPQRDDNPLYNILSDSSVDGDGLDQAEVNRRFQALSRGEFPPPLPLPLRRVAGTAQRKRSHTINPTSQNEDSQMSLSQVKNRMFFKNKRGEGKKTKKSK